MLPVATVDTMAQSPVRAVTERFCRVVAMGVGRGGSSRALSTTAPTRRRSASSSSVSLNPPPNSFLHPWTFSSSCYLETEKKKMLKPT